MSESVTPQLPFEYRSPGCPCEPGERWLPIPGYEGRYDLSTAGRCWSVYREGVARTGVIMKPSYHNYGYPYVSLYDAAGRHRRHMVHALVALTFIGERPDGREVCHNNGDPGCTDVANFRYDDHTGNMGDQEIHGTHVKRNKTHCPQDHPYSGDNLVIMSNGGRACKICRQASRDRAAEKKRAERGPRVLAKEQPCTVSTCDELQLAKGLCARHYNRRQRGLELEDARTCLQCGAPYENAPGKEGRRKYCSVECMAEANRQRARERAQTGQ